DESRPTRRHHGADDRTGAGDGLFVGRSRHGREPHACGDGGLSEYHGATGASGRTAGRHFVFWPGLERAEVAANRVRIRAGDEGTERAAVRGEPRRSLARIGSGSHTNERTPHPGPLPSDGRGRVAASLSAIHGSSEAATFS